LSELPFIEESELAGGLKVLSHAMPESQSVALGIFLDVGSRDERPEQAGIAHALEHMLFKGTRRFDVVRLGELLDQLGGNANAFTSRERTCFHIHGLHEDWPQALDLLASMLLEATIPDEEWQREREVIFSEMAMVEDTPEEWVFDQHMLGLFPEQTLGRPTLGTQASLTGISAADLRDYLGSNYRPPRLLISAAGRIDHAQLIERVGSYNWPTAEAAPARVAPAMASGLQLLPRNIEQAHLLVSCPGIASASEERPLAWLANQLLGGGMSSRLFREVREKRGLAYSVGSHLSSLADGGIWTVSCAADPARLPECIEVVGDTMQRFADSLGEEEIARAKRQIEVQMRMAMDSPEGYMLLLGTRFDEANIRAQPEWIELLKKVERDELRQWIVARLATPRLTTLAGPAKVVERAAKRLG